MRLGVRRTRRTSSAVPARTRYTYLESDERKQPEGHCALGMSRDSRCAAAASIRPPVSMVTGARPRLTSCAPSIWTLHESSLAATNTHRSRGELQPPSRRAQKNSCKGWRAPWRAPTAESVRRSAAPVPMRRTAGSRCRYIARGVALARAAAASRYTGRRTAKSPTSDFTAIVAINSGEAQLLDRSNQRRRPSRSALRQATGGVPSPSIAARARLPNTSCAVQQLPARRFAPRSDGLHGSASCARAHAHFDAPRETA